MGTKIEWTDATWNAVTGCTKVSDGCRFCYAEVTAKRFWATQYPDVVFKNGSCRPRRFTDVQCHDDRLSQPLRWRKPRRIFVNSVSDLFHPKVPKEFIGRVFAVMAEAKHHIYQILTKRPERMLELLGPDSWMAGKLGRGVWCPTHPEKLHRNVWLGVSVEDQATADERIPLLLDTPAAIHFVSYEPALGPVDFDKLLSRDCPNCAGMAETVNGWPCVFCRETGERWVDWIIVGGESGHGARPFNLAWPRRTIQQCHDAKVMVFIKQLGARPCHPMAVAPFDQPGARLNLRHAKGGDMKEWPDELRVREFPELPPRYA